MEDRRDFDEIAGGLVDLPEEIFLEDRELEMRIEKQINRRITKICLRTLLFVSAMAAVLILIINPLMKMNFLDPRPMFSKGEADYENEFTDYFGVYIETSQPWTEVYSAECEDHGFGKYIIDLNIFDTKGPVYIGATPNVKMTVERGKIETEDPEHLLTIIGNRFTPPPGGKEDLDGIIRDIRELPDSTVLSLAVGVKKDLPVTELLKTDIFVDWVEIYNEKSGIQGGMAVSKAVLHDSDKNRREMDDAELKREYLNNLDFLLSKPEWLEALGIRMGSNDGYTRFFKSTEPVEELRKYTEEQEILTTRHYCISGK